MPKLTEVPVSTAANDAEQQLIRGVGLWGATTLNMIDMIGVGPFITIPLIIAAMGGPQAMLGWILGALLVVCDGLVWAELGAALPGSGGSYRYLAEIYGARKLGRLMSFLFIWQLTFSAPLSIASGSIGLAQYATYIFPGLGHETKVTLPILGSVEINAIPVALVAIAAVGLAVCCPKVSRSSEITRNLRVNMREPHEVVKNVPPNLTSKWCASQQCIRPAPCVRTGLGSFSRAYCD